MNDMLGGLWIIHSGLWMVNLWVVLMGRVELRKSGTIRIDSGFKLFVGHKQLLGRHIVLQEKRFDCLSLVRVTVIDI